MLKIENLSYEYEDGTKALNNVDIDLAKGKVIGIIGANGSGKSTLFLNMMGILKPNSGRVIFKGKGLKYSKKYLRQYRKQVNIVFQNPDQQLFYSSVYDDVAFSLRNMGMDEIEIKNRVYKALEKVDGLDLINKPVHFLSYGQKKRIAIAGVLAMDLDTLLLDEPTAGLDPYMTKEIKKIIEEISCDKTIVISSHDMDLIYDICDYIYVISKGEVIGQGNKRDVFLQEDLIIQANLEVPWLIKIHRILGIPLCENEIEFINIKN